MAEVERLVRGGYELGALAATDRALGFYAARGWVPWRGTASVLAPEGVRRTPGEEDALLLLPVSADPRGGDLVCDWREGDVW
jgi:aminoglycoside 2'-N-acetyltransferase I